jgi:hypothetical protein
MENYENFTKELFEVFDEKVKWYDTEELPRLLEEYRRLLSHVGTIYTTLLKKSTISADPYKLEKKISEIKPISNKAFNDSERSLVIGTRLSDYESMLDFICNFFTFSVSNIKADRIKKLIEFNNGFQWNAVIATSACPNTKGLSDCLIPIRQGTDALATSLLNDSLSNAAKSVEIINNILKEFGDFQREVYKVEVRKDVIGHPSFFVDKVFESKETMLAQIKKIFHVVSTKKPFYSELIDEIIEESIGENAKEKQQKLVSKLVVKKSSKQAKEKQVDTRQILMDAVRSLGGIVTQLESIITKFQANSELLENEKTSFWSKLIAIIQKAFNLDKKPIVYKIVLVDNMTQSKHYEHIDFNEFIQGLQKRCKYYLSFSTRKTPGYEKIEAMSDEKVVEFITKNLSECQRLLGTLTALDDFFKETVAPLDRSKVKGTKMEISSLKNTIIKTNQRKAEYSSIIEEQKQMQKLGLI